MNTGLPNDPYERFLQSLSAGRLGLVRDLKRDYGASGSAQTTTGSMTAGSNVLTLASAIDFQDGQGIVVPHAGGGPYQNGSTTALLAAPSGITIATTGTVGAGYTYTYYVVAINARGGISGLSAAVSVTITQSALSDTIYNTITVPAVAGASSYGLFGDANNPVGSQGWLGSANPFAPIDLYDRGTTNFYAIQQPNWIPDYTSIPSNGIGDFLSTTISAGGGSTTLTLAHSAGSATIAGAVVYHNDESIITSALSDCATNNYALHIPPGTYHVWNGVTGHGYSNLYVYGAGTNSIIQQIGGSITNTILLGGLSDCYFRDFLIDGGWEPANGGGQVWNSAFESLGNGFSVWGNSDTDYSERVTINNITARNTGQSGIRMGMWYFGNDSNIPSPFAAGCKDSFVIDCKTYNNHDQGIAVWDSDKVSVIGCLSDGQCYAGISLTNSTNCTVSGCVSKNNVWVQTQDPHYGGTGGYGAEIESGYGHTITGNVFANNFNGGVYIHNWQPAGSGNPAVGHTVSNNTFIYDDNNQVVHNSTGVFIWARYPGTLQNVTIDNNVLYVSPGFNVSAGGWGVSVLQETGTTENITVANNTFYNVVNNGVLVQAPGVSVDGNSVYNSTGWNPGIQIGSTSSTPLTGSCTNNRVENCHPGIQIGPVTGFLCTGNSVSDCGYEGITLESVTLSTVADNVVKNTQNAPGITLSGTTNGNMIRGNLCIDTQTTPTQTYGIQEQSGVTGNVYEGNTFSGNTSGPIQFASGSTSVARNNPGYNPVGALTAPTVGASPWTYTNDNNVPVTLYVTGGTVTGIAQYGVTTGLIAGAFALEPGQSVTVTYTAAPAVALIGA